MEFLLHAIRLRYNSQGMDVARPCRFCSAIKKKRDDSKKSAGFQAVGLRERPVSASEMRLNLPLDPVEVTEGASREDFRDSPPLQRCVETGKK